jgi:hypothetical protein
MILYSNSCSFGAKDQGQDIILGNIQFESIDTIVTNQLTNIASDHYDPNLLLDIYRHL